MNNSDSKYYNTSLLMNEALLQLLEKKEYDFITVTEICKKAGVNRSTFYLHYETIDDLLFETVERINKKFHLAFNNQIVIPAEFNKEDLFFINDSYIIPYLHFIKENRKVYQLIHKEPYIFKLHDTFSSLYNNLFSVILEKYGVPEEEKEYIFSFFSFGLVAVIQKWIERGCEDDINKVATLMKNFIGYKNET